MSGTCIHDRDSPTNALSVDTTGALKAAPTSLYPSGATAITASSAVVADAAAVATLAAAVGKTTYISGF